MVIYAYSNRNYVYITDIWLALCGEYVYIRKNVSVTC